MRDSSIDTTTDHRREGGRRGRRGRREVGREGKREREGEGGEMRKWKENEGKKFQLVKYYM